MAGDGGQGSFQLRAQMFVLIGQFQRGAEMACILVIVLLYVRRTGSEDLV